MSTVLRSSATADELNQWFAGIDAMRESDNPGGESATEATLDAGQAAVDVINASRGKP
jgi:hypothetical protein